MINKVILVGNVGIDPEVRAIESGVKVARVRLATTERIFNRQTNESTEHTEAYGHFVARPCGCGGSFRAQGQPALYRGQPAHARMDGQGESETLYDRDHRVGHETARQAIRQSCPADNLPDRAVISRRAGFRADMPRSHRRRAGMRNPRHSPCSPPPLRSFRRPKIPTICRSETVAAGDDAVFVSCTDGCRSKERHPYFYSKMRGGLQNVDHPAYRGPLLVSAALRTVAGCGRKATVRTNFVSRFNPCCGSAAAPTLPAGSVARAAPAGRSGGRSLRGVCRVPKHGTASRRPSRGA